MSDFSRAEEARAMIRTAKGGIEITGIDQRILVPNVVESLRKRDDEIESLRAANTELREALVVAQTVIPKLRGLVDLGEGFAGSPLEWVHEAQSQIDTALAKADGS